MAVKQNNTEGNGSADANQGNNGNGVKSTGTITKLKKMNSNATNGESGGGALAAGVSLSSGGNTELPGCSGNTGASSQPKFNSLASNTAPELANAGGSNSIANFLHMIEIVERQISDRDMPQIHLLLIRKLACVQPPGQSEDLKRFKEDMTKVGAFFNKSLENDKYHYSMLHFVCQLITMSDGEVPSCALAVIFELFTGKRILEAVQKLLKHNNVTDPVIRKIVSLLCAWLPICNFCQNLQMWILGILTGLHDRNKSALVEQIALENIENLFRSLMLPAFRQRVAPVVLHMLSSIDHNPEVFYKILPRFPLYFEIIKKNMNNEKNPETAKIILQQLVDQVSHLMARFPRCDNTYRPIEMAIKGFQPSNNNLNYGYESNSFRTNSTQNPNPKVGLVNLGNTCYMNSVLQALAMTKEFSREILLSESKSPLLIKMQQQIAFMLYSTRQELTPSKVLNATRPPGFSPGLQQDSSEFLGYLLETLHEQEVAFVKKSPNILQYYGETKEMSKRVMSNADNTNETGASALYENEEDDDNREYEHDNTTNNCNISSNTDAADSTKSTNLQTTNTNTSPSSAAHIPITSTTTTPLYTNLQTSTIEKTFTGKLATTYKCLTCGWKSCNIDSFRDLQLSFPDVKNDCASNYSVQDLIEYYCSSEKLYGDNQYFCERCKKLSDAERYINVISAPKNLILTLKHFKYDQKYHMRAKLMHKVFHDEKVSLKVCAPESLEEIATVHYDLYAGVVHSGFSMDSGHYYTYAADASNEWYKFNDSIVTPSKTEELHNLTPPNTPYILFYQMGARSNETPETSASTKVIKVDVPTPLTLEELPHDLRDMVTHDNYVFSEELKMRRYKNASNLNANVKKTQEQRRDSFEDDDDEHQPPPSGCGSNAMNINMNRFVY